MEKSNGRPYFHPPRHNFYCSGCLLTRVFEEKEGFWECLLCKKRLWKRKKGGNGDYGLDKRSEV